MIQALGVCCNLRWGTGTKSVPFAFDWTDGAAGAAKGTKVTGGLQWANSSSPMLGYGFSFTVPATTGAQRLKVWTHDHHGTGTLTVTIGSVTQTVPGVEGNENDGRIYTIDFTGDGTSGQVMTVTYTLGSFGSNNNASNVGVYAAALSAAADFTISAGSGSLSVPRGGQATSVLSITPVGSSTGTVSLSAVASRTPADAVPLGLLLCPRVHPLANADGRRGTERRAGHLQRHRQRDARERQPHGRRGRDCPCRGRLHDQRLAGSPASLPAAATS